MSRLSAIAKIILKHLLTLLIATFFLFLLMQAFPDDPSTCILGKPVIYLYPEKTTDVTVQLDVDSALTAVYPVYHDGWRVTAQPDGTLKDAAGREYYCLYWEAESDIQFDFSQGFCVPGSETAVFLETALEQLGLTQREANEFIIYWLPQMENNPYNLISFQTETYTDIAKLTVTPAPDTMIRVFMAWKEADAPVDIPSQHHTAPQRSGFTVVEWGASQVD